MSEHLDADQQNALDEAYSVQRAARAALGGENQDLKVVEECSEVIIACARLSRALVQRLTHYKNGGQRGDVDEEAGDALFTILGLMPADSPAWDSLRAKTEKLRAKLEGGAGG